MQSSRSEGVTLHAVPWKKQKRGASGSMEKQRAAQDPYTSVREAPVALRGRAGFEVDTLLTLHCMVAKSQVWIIVEPQ